MLDYHGFLHSWFERVWNQRDASAIREFMAPDVVLHGLDEQGGDQQIGISEVLAFHKAILDGFGELRCRVHQTLSSAWGYAVRWSGSFRHTGNFIGIEPTDKWYHVGGMGFGRMSADGKRIVEAWDNWELEKMVRQMRGDAPTRISVQSPATAYGLSLDQNFTFVGHNARQIVGIRASDLMRDAKAWLRRVHEEDMPRLRAGWRRAIAQGRSTVEYRVRGDDNITRLIRDDMNFDGNLIFGSWADASEEWQLAQELDRRQAARERELAYELHDHLGQMIIGATGMAQALEQLVTSSKPNSANIGNLCGELVRTLASANRAVSDCTHGLMPFDSRSEQFSHALNELGRRVERRPGVKCIVALKGNIDDLDGATQTQLFRIIQEATSNALKHGKAHQLRVKLNRLRNGFFLRIDDDGCGFEIEEPRRRGMGLRIMEHRANLVGAAFALRSLPGEGTTVACWRQ